MSGPPMYLESGREITTFRHSFECRVPVMLVGPTGCGKTRLVEHMAAALGRPLVTVTCHEDLTTSDLLGRFLVRGGDVEWVDGPLTRAVRSGAICYLDEVIEARRDTLAALHPLGDHRRRLFLERTGEVIDAPPGFMLVCSHNPRARGALKELKPSFRQRFVTMELGYLPEDKEAEVLVAESAVNPMVARRLVRQAAAMRSARDLREVPSTRLLVTAAFLIANGLPEDEAVEVAVLGPLSVTATVADALRALVRACDDGRSAEVVDRGS